MSFSAHIRDVELQPEPLDPADVLDGAPEVSGAELWSSPDGRTARGVWRCTPGVLRDVEVDEMFVVVEGRATIEIEDGPTLEVGPGDVAVLERGARTVWTVRETLLKAYQTTE